MPCVAQHGDGFLQRQVRRAAQPVKSVEQTAAILHYSRASESLPSAATVASEMPGGAAGLSDDPDGWPHRVVA